MTIPVPALLLLLIICMILIVGCSKVTDPAPCASPEKTDKPRKPLKILFIGNSLTICNNLPRMIKHLAGKAPEPMVIQVESSAFGGATLGDNWNKGDALKKIRRGDWSHVVLQGLSTEPVDNREGFFKHVRLFDEEIKKIGAKTLLYMTWEHKNAPPEQRNIAATYEEIGREIGASVVPVGLVWRNLLDIRPDAPLYTEDGKHPTPEGSYLAACVFHAVLNSHSPSGLPSEIPQLHDPKQLLVKLSRNEAAIYEQIARQTVQAAAESPNP